MTMDEVLKQSDVVFLLTPKSTGDDFLGAKDLGMMKDSTLLVNIASRSLVNNDALFQELSTGRLRAVQDGPADERFKDLPLSVWFNSNASTAYNTFDANKKASDMAVESIINLLSKGVDSHKVN